MKTRPLFVFASLLLFLASLLPSAVAAQQDLPWQNDQRAKDNYRPDSGRRYQEPGEAYDRQQHGDTSRQGHPRKNQPQYRPNDNIGGYDALRNQRRPQREYDRGVEAPRPHANEDYGSNRGNGVNTPYQEPRRYDDQYNDQRRPRQPYAPSQGYPRQGYQPPNARGPGQPYAAPYNSGRDYQRDDRRQDPERPSFSNQQDYDGTYSDDEILKAGHRFFGKITKGLAKVIAHVFKKSGRPNAYILGEEGGGALVAGLRYGEGTVYTKAGDRQRIYWQGPSIGYDFGAEGAKTMILVYNLRHINDIYHRFAGVDGSAYLVGGVGVTFQKRGRIVLAPIRSGLGVRLGANIGYLKYTRRPTWNPF